MLPIPRKLLFWLFLLFFAGTAQFSYSQIDDPDSLFNAIKGDMENEFQQFKEEQEQMFNEFVEKNDKIFSDYLQNAWEEYALQAGIEPPDRPKPDKTPKIDPVKADENTEDEIPVSTPDKDTTGEKTGGSPNAPPIQKTEPEDFDKASESFHFYGKSINFKYDKAFVSTSPGIDNEAIAGFWDTMVETNHYHLINQLRDYKTRMNLNDWGYFLLVKNTAKQIATDRNTQKLLTWFLMTKSRYKIKVAHNNNTVFLMLPSQHKMYEKPYYTFKGTNYYLFSESYNGNIQTYDKSYADAQKIMDFDIYKPLNLGKNIGQKTIRFSYNDQDYSFPIKYNKSNVKFYDDYPRVEIKIYFDAVMSVTAKESILNELMAITEGKSELETAGLLLNFTQTAFDYKTDDEQFGHEKFFFPEEVIHFPYSDCEDRSVLFAYLVREILNTEVIGLGYPNHMATGVHFSKDLGRDHFVYNGKKYTICDPTYKSAPIGMCMPKYKDVEAEFIKLDNHQFEAYSKKEIWDIVNKAGGYRGGSNEDVVFDEAGNAYVTGFFKGKANFGDNTIVSTDSTNDIFIAKYNKNNTLEWVRTIKGKGNDAGNTIALDNNGYCYIKGTFEDALHIRETTLKSENEYDIFLAKFNTDGDFGWSSKVRINKGERKADVTYAARFSSNGEPVSVVEFPNTENFTNYGISFQDNNEILVTASYSSSAVDLAKARKKFFNAGANYSPLRIWKAESKNLREQNYEKTIAGLFAFMKTMKSNGTIIEGEVIQEALMESNPSFKKNAPRIYKSIGNISLMKNSGGIIIVKTHNGDHADFDIFTIDNNAKLKITTYRGGNGKVNFLSGGSIGKSYIRFDLNYIKLKKYSGNLVFDYDNDHSQKTINLRKDILR